MTKKHLAIVFAYAALGVVFYLLPMIRNNATAFLIILFTLGIGAMKLGIEDASKTSGRGRGLYPALYVLLYFLPIAITEWIILQSKDFGTIFNQSVNGYEHYGLLYLFAPMIIVAFGVIGAWWIKMVKTAEL
ncbi:MAG: hypothetical protein AAB733_01115 [Patescibacteria group bacterium]